MDAKLGSVACTSICASSCDSHCHLGHASLETLNKLFPTVSRYYGFECQFCQLRKHHRVLPIQGQ